jgi:tetratricopeptide (TPR) repeat protein
MQQQLKTLLSKQKYAQALDQVHKIRQAYPEAQSAPEDAGIWLLRGKQELEHNELESAETSLRQALDLGLKGEVHYCLAKSLIGLDRADEALSLIQQAFETKVLPKDYAGCYLKLLMLQGHLEQVKALVEKQAQRFYAPQLHWARGILALKAEQFEVALTHFQKMGRPATPGDWSTVWPTYVHQQLQQWGKTSVMLGLEPLGGFSSSRQQFPEHPAMQRLALFQALATQRSLSKVLDFKQTEFAQRPAALVFELVQLIDQKNYHEAAHIVLQLPQPAPDWPEVDQLYRPLLILAGEQALQEDQPGCAETFWGQIAEQSPFDPQLAVNLSQVLHQTGSHHRNCRLLSELLKWLQQAAKQYPDTWPDSRLKPTLAKLHCLLVDTYLALGQYREVERALQEATRLCPDLPDVLGRRGLKSYVHGDFSRAADLLNRALEGGYRSGEAYHVLLECWEELGDDDALKAARRQFGKHFGDIGVDLDVEIPAWIEALSLQRYDMLFKYVEEQDNPDLPLRACQVFIRASDDNPNSRERVTLNLERAKKQWNQLLKPLSAQEKIPVLQAIYLSLQLYAQRQKGLAALQKEYLNQLSKLSQDYPEAQQAQLVLLAVKEKNSDRLEPPLKEYLSQASDPNTALAQLQLQVRWFAQTPVLRSRIEEALRRDPQNPLLLLAKATTFPIKSSSYTTFKDQGFELARRLQDAPALQAFREEDKYEAHSLTRHFLPDLFELEDMDEMDLIDILQRMAKQFFGKDIPPEMIEAMLPELQARMEEEFGGFGAPDDEFDEFEEGGPFGFAFGPPPDRGKKTRRGKRGFS